MAPGRGTATVTVGAVVAIGHNAALDTANGNKSTNNRLYMEEKPTETGVVPRPPARHLLRDSNTIKSANIPLCATRFWEAYLANIAIATPDVYVNQLAFRSTAVVVCFVE